MADTGNGNPTAGGSGAGRNVPVQAQNVVIDANAQAAAAQMAQQILANTNVTLKQELVKIPDFWGEKGKDTVTPTQFMARIDECQIANDWTTQPPTPISAFASEEKLTNGWLQKLDSWNLLRLKKRGRGYALCSRRNSLRAPTTSSSSTVSPTWPTDLAKIHENSCQGWKNLSTH